MGKHRILVVAGTRPEAIKVAPVVLALTDTSDFEPFLASTGQHDGMLNEALSGFGLEVRLSLDVLSHGQSLGDLTAAALRGMSTLFASDSFEAVIVQGDTTTTLASGLAGFYARVPVIHLEAGLRTGDPRRPYPEEMNRRLTAQIADLHMAPTESARTNLLREGIASESILVTGNTGIDALMYMASHGKPSASVANVISGHEGPLVLVTAHRRESWGPPIRAIARAVRDLSIAHPKVLFYFPAHPNPIVRKDLLEYLSDPPNAVVAPPVAYADLVCLMKRSHHVLTDSGGIQEEAPALGKPVLVMRDTTERPEAVDAGVSLLVGSDTSAIVRESTRLLTDSAAYDGMAQVVSPFGDGHAADRVVAGLRRLLAAKALS